MSQKNEIEHPAPWRVVQATLQPQLGVIYVVDANGSTVLPWSAFDYAGCTYASRLRLAERIVRSANKYDWVVR